MSENISYANLKNLSTQTLEDMLRADIESPEDLDDDLVFSILEVIREREESEHKLCDVDKAWENFTAFYHTPEGEGRTLYSSSGVQEIEYTKSAETAFVTSGRAKAQSAVRKLASVAAVIALLFSVVVTAQAFGFDILGAIAKWTDETFHFAPAGYEQTDADIQNEGYSSALQKALVDCGISPSLAPTWYPDGFEMSEPEMMSNAFQEGVYCFFSSEDERYFSIEIQRFFSASDLATQTFEKDSALVEEFSNASQTFYILSNEGGLTATWSDGYLCESIYGNISREEIESIITSIGGTIK